MSKIRPETPDEQYWAGLFYKTAQELRATRYIAAELIFEARGYPGREQGKTALVDQIMVRTWARMGEFEIPED